MLLINSREMSKDVGTRTKRLSNKRILTDIKSMERTMPVLSPTVITSPMAKGFFCDEEDTADEIG